MENNTNQDLKCPQCGSTYKNVDKFCPSCGVELKNNAETKFKSNKKAIIPLIAIIVLIAGFFGVKAYMEYISSPNYVAEHFLKYIVEEKYQDAYKYLDPEYVESNNILNYENFEKAFKNSKITSYMLVPKSVLPSNEKLAAKVGLELKMEYNANLVANGKKEDKVLLLQKKVNKKMVKFNGSLILMHLQ